MCSYLKNGRLSVQKSWTIIITQGVVRITNPLRSPKKNLSSNFLFQIKKLWQKFQRRLLQDT